MKTWVYVCAFVAFFAISFVALVGEAVQSQYLFVNGERPADAPSDVSTDTYEAWHRSATETHESRLCFMLVLPVLVFQIAALCAYAYFYGMSKDEDVRQTTSAVFVLLLSVSLCFYYGSLWPLVHIFIVFMVMFFSKDQRNHWTFVMSCGFFPLVAFFFLNVYYILVRLVFSKPLHRACESVPDGCAKLDAIVTDMSMLRGLRCLGERTYLERGYIMSILYVSMDDLRLPADELRTLLVFYYRQYDSWLRDVPLTCVVFALAFAAILACWPQKQPDESVRPAARNRMAVHSMVWVLLAAFTATEYVMVLWRGVLAGHEASIWASVKETVGAELVRKVLASHLHEWSFAHWVAERLSASRPSMQTVLRAIA